MSISIKDTEHIAKLSRLDLSGPEKKKFSHELSSILDYVEQLKEVNTEKVEPTAQVTGLTNVMREDKINDCDKKTREAILDNAPTRDGDFIKVKSVF